MSKGGRLILVVDDDVGVRRLVRTGLELEGFSVIEAANLAQARSVETERVDGVVLDRQLPDGDGLIAYDELQARYADATVVLHSSTFVPSGYPSVTKGDIDAMVDLFGVAPDPLPPAGRAPAVARELAADTVAEWLELCKWDPELPADDHPPIATSVVAGVAAALERPQPLGWGLDPALETVAETYMLNHRSVEDAVAELVCLREAFERRVVESVPVAEQMETARRLTMIVHRLMTVVVRAGVADLRDRVFTDPVTGLGNARAFEVDVEREQGRAVRHDRPLTLVKLAVGGLDGDDDGSAARRVASALKSVPGDEVLVYRTGWSHFALLLPDAVPVDADFVRGPLTAAGFGDVALGVATSPPEAAERLEEGAEHRMRSSRVPFPERVRHEGGPDL